MHTTKLKQLIVLPLLATATFGFAACGDNGVDEEALKDVQKQGEQIQDKAKSVSEDAAKLSEAAKKTSEDVASGKITAEEAEKKIQEQTDAVEDRANEVVDDAKDAGSDAIDAVKNNDNLPDDAKKALEDAQAELNK